MAQSGSTAGVSVAAIMVVAVLGGCSADPGAPLIPTPKRQATALPSEVPAVRPNGFPNVLADPVMVPGRPRNPDIVGREVEALEARGAAVSSRAAALPRGANAAELGRRGRTHVEETRRAIEAGARPPTAQPPRLSDMPPAAVPAAHAGARETGSADG